MVSIRRLVWDSWKVAHIARHQVTPDEVEEVSHGEYITRQTYDDRLLLIGPTLSGRTLVVILGPTDKTGIYYPVTARPARKSVVSIRTRGVREHDNQKRALH